MISERLRQVFRRQGYAIVGKHSVVHPCRWCKKSLIDEGVCYKEKFYGIKSHLCCQMSPCTNCQNKCLHCWRAIELSDDKEISKELADEPSFIIDESIKAQKKLLTGFKGNKKINIKKFEEAQEPMQFAISLTGEPTLYPRLGEFIKELRKRGKTSFLVSNGLQPEVFKKLQKENALPTQLYLSLNTPDKDMYDKWHRSSEKDAWKNFNESLDLMKKLKSKTRTVLRMTLVKELNMMDSQIQGYIKMIRKASPDFIEVKGYMSVGFARKRLGYEKMPRINSIRNYAERIAIELGEGYKILDEHERSAVVLIGKDRKRMKIKKREV
jgi:tRNA wybutosine-synthesizing protein 1